MEAKTEEMTPERILQIFRLISDQDCLDMGLNPQFARPDWFIITCLPVPPMAVRPSISIDGMGRGEDDLTHKLSEIIKANNMVKNQEAEGAPAHILKELETILQYHIATYMDNEISGLPQSTQKSGRPVFCEII